MSWPTNNWSPNYKGQRALGPLSMNIPMKPNVAAQVTPQIQDNSSIFAAADKAQANDPTAAMDPKIASARSALRAMGLMIPPGKVQTVLEAGAAKHGVDTQKVLFESAQPPSRRGGAELPRYPSQEATLSNGEPVKAAGALSSLQPLARQVPKDWLSGERSTSDIAADAYRNWFGDASLPGGSHLKTPGNYYLRTPQILRDLAMDAMRQQFSRPQKVTGTPRFLTYADIKGMAKHIPEKFGMDKQAVLEPIWGGLGGAYVAPKTKRLEGAARGMGVGLTSMLGGLGTGTLGYQLAKGRNLGTTSIAGYDIPNEVLVGLASSIPGNALGYLAGKEMFWPKRWEDPQERVKEDVKSLIGLRQGG